MYKVYSRARMPLSDYLNLSLCIFVTIKRFNFYKIVPLRMVTFIFYFVPKNYGKQKKKKKNYGKQCCEWQAGIGRNCKEGGHVYIGAECLKRGRTVRCLDPTGRVWHTFHFLLLYEATRTAWVWGNKESESLSLQFENPIPRFLNCCWRRGRNLSLPC